MLNNDWLVRAYWKFQIDRQTRYRVRKLQANKNVTGGKKKKQKTRREEKQEPKQPTE